MFGTRSRRQEREVVDSPSGSGRVSPDRIHINRYRRAREKVRGMLTKDVANVGKAGDVKEVTDGYGRNFLLPRKLAVRAHQGVEAEAKRRQDAAAKRETKDRVDAQT